MADVKGKIAVYPARGLEFLGGMGELWKIDVTFCYMSSDPGGVRWWNIYTPQPSPTATARPTPRSLKQLLYRSHKYRQKCCK